MIRTLFKTCLLLFCFVLLWSKADNAMATCGLTSAQSRVYLTQNITFAKNSNGTTANESPKATFWSGSPDETYTCPATSTQMFFCGTDDQYVAAQKGTVLGPGIYAGGYASDGSKTTLAYGGCFGYSTSGEIPATGQMGKGALTSWTYAGVQLVIQDSNQARNITVDNKFVGTIFLTTEDYKHKEIPGGPLTYIYLSGNITIPASCSLASNGVVTLPDTYSGEYSKAGAGVKIGTGTTQPMSIKCLGGSESATIDLHITTSKVSGDDILTSNPDVGVRVLDGSGKTVSANNGKTSATLSAGEVDVPFTYVPVATTGKNPTPGDYSAIETITVTIP